MAATPAAVAKGRTFLYARVSTDDQSASTQLQILRQKYPDALEFVDEGVSAWKTPLQNRPAGGQMLQILQPGDVVVALRPDRLFRSLKDAANQIDAIHAKGAILAIAESGIRTDDLFGRLLMGMLSAFAQLESEETSRATKHAAAIALATNENLLQQRLPRALSNRIPLRQKHYVFQDVFTPQEMSDLWLKVYLTYKQYRNVPACVSCVCNQALHEKGLPPLIAMPYTNAAEYARALRRKGTALCKRVAAVVDSHTHVASPVNPNRFMRNAARFKEFMDIHQQLPREQRSLSLTEMFRNHPTVIGVVSAAANSAAD
jgi:DNA invertase Pin-like site-specific DNA recombinase